MEPLEPTRTQPEAYVLACLLHGETQRALTAMEECGPTAAYAGPLATAALKKLAAGALDEACILAETAFALDGASAGAARALGCVRVKSGAAEEGEALLRGAAEMQPHEGSTAALLAKLYLQWERPADAIPYVRAALATSASPAEALELFKKLRKAADRLLPRTHPAFGELQDLAVEARRCSPVETLSLCLIVRNEARNLRRVLESVRGVANELIVVDTGSTDDTVRLAKRLGANVDHFAWVDDFAAARNHSLHLATCDWVLVMDADDELTPESKELVRGWLSNPRPEVEVVGLYRRYPYPGKRRDGVTVQPRLFRNARGFHFESPIHERLVKADGSPARAETVLNAVMLHHGIAGADVAARRQERNLTILLPYLERTPEDARGQFYAGAILLEQEKWADCVPHFRAAIDAAPEDADFLPKAFGCLGYALLQVKMPLEAEDALREGLAAFPRYPDLNYCLGLVLDNTGRLEEAAQAHEAAVDGRFGPGLNWHDWSSREDRPHVSLADLKTALGDFEGALRHLELAEGFTGPKPLYDDLRSAVAAAVEERGRREDEEVARLQRWCEEAENGNFEAGIRLVRAVGPGAEAFVEAWPDSVEKQIAAGWLLLHQGKERAARDHFAAIRAEYAESVEARRGEAAARRALGDGGGAIRLLNKILALRPDDAEAAEDLGAICSGLNAWEQAVSAYEKSVATDNSRWTAWLGLGKALLQVGKTSGAIQSFQRAATLSGGDPAVRVALGQARAHLARRAQPQPKAAAA
jgi:tetratricopeptide (TPR) repeat protein